MSELSSPQNLEEVCAYLELCVEEAKDKAWGDGISFALCFIKKLLPSAQPERTDCEYCHEDIDGYVKPIEKNCHAFIRFGMNGWELNLRAKGWHGEVKIKLGVHCAVVLKG